MYMQHYKIKDILTTKLIEKYFYTLFLDYNHSEL